MAKKKSGAQQAQDHAPPPPGASSLIICRNKHWRYISSFHGPWLQLPPEILDSLAHQNYTMPAPRLVDPAVFYDVVKIRKAVDEAAQDSVRASTGVSNTASNGGRMDYFGAGGGPSSQLSKERIFKIRQKAVKLLNKAFIADEVAASVASMQATSTVEDVGSHVLKREPHSLEGKYVHFFHEKIPSRAMEAYTPLDPLNDIISALPLEQQAPPLRTRALVQIFKHNYEGAVLDLTSALRIVEEGKRMHRPGKQEVELASRMREEQEAWRKGMRDWRAVPQLKEEDQPKSLEQQLYFNRGGVYLTLACQSVHAALDGLSDYLERSESRPGSLTEKDEKAQAVRLEARKKVKTYAKRALKDYMAFISHFDYTPGLPFEITNEIMRRVYDLANGNKMQTPTPQPPARNRLVELDGDGKEINPNSSGDENDSSPSSAKANGNSALIKHHSRPSARTEPFERGEDGWPRFPTPKIHPASALFAEKPPSDIPLFPSQAQITAMLNNTPSPEPTFSPGISSALNSREAVTYHPLLTDALHSLLLAHALAQTSPTELLRHAHNAARLCRVADGYPIFQAARSPARADWIEVLRRANNWLGLSVPWQKLCAPAPLPEAAGGWVKEGGGVGGSGGGALATKRGGGAGQGYGGADAGKKEESAEQKRERIKQESIIDALSDDRVVDEESFQKAVRARERRALEDEAGLSGPLKDRDALPSASSSTRGSADTSLSPSPGTPTNSAQSSEDAAPSLPNQAQQPQQQQQPKRWAQDENGKEYPISTDRAEAIARWIKEAPLTLGGSGRKKRRPAGKKKEKAAAAETNGIQHAAQGVAGMQVRDGEEEGLD